MSRGTRVESDLEENRRLKMGVNKEKTEPFLLPGEEISEVKQPSKKPKCRVCDKVLVWEGEKVNNPNKESVCWYWNVADAAGICRECKDEKNAEDWADNIAKAGDVKTDGFPVIRGKERERMWLTEKVVQIQDSNYYGSLEIKFEAGRMKRAITTKSEIPLF